MGKYIPPTPAEIHSLGWGFMDGAIWKKQSYEKRIKAGIQVTDDIKNEPHYYRLGYFLSNRGKWVFAAGAALPCL